MAATKPVKVNSSTGDLADFQSGDFIATTLGGTGVSNTATDGHILIGSTSGADYADGQLTSSGNTLTITKGSGTLNVDLSPITNYALIVGTGSTGYNVVAPAGTAGTALVSAGAAADPVYGAVALGSTGTVSGTLPVGNGGTGQTINYNILPPVAESGSFAASVAQAYLVTLSGAATCTLPTAVGSTGQTLSVTLLSTGFVLSFATTASQTINAQATFTNGISQYGQTYTFISDGANWWTNDAAFGFAGNNSVFVSGSGGNIGWQAPLNTSHGGTGTATAPSAVGQLLINTSGNTYTPANLTASTNQGIINTSGSITLFSIDPVTCNYAGAV